MHLTLAAAETLVFDGLTRNRVSEANACSVARALVAAEAAGQGGHGLRRVEAYSRQARAGKVDGFATPSLSRPLPAVVQIDANHGYAIRLSISRCLSFPISCGSRASSQSPFAAPTTRACWR
jgi:(2R)-3-sulfolactate dehydrogenase (NADP+)